MLDVSAEVHVWFTLFGSPSPFRRRRKFASSELIFNEAAIPSFYKSIFTTVGLFSPNFSFLPLILAYLNPNLL
jgi:hypothetical protein